MHAWHLHCAWEVNLLTPTYVDRLSVWRCKICIGCYHSVHAVCLSPTVCILCLLVADAQRLLLMGRRHDALNVALAGQLWGPALVLAHRYGE
jgi:hypothetical protein